MSKGTILIADDDASIRTVLNQALTRAGFDVRMTSCAYGLWKWIEAGEGDVVISDVVMPDDNIFNLLPNIKKTRPDLPIIIMSAQNTFMTAINAADKGAYEYLPKPFDLQELVEIVKKAYFEPQQQKTDPAPLAEDPMPLVGRSPAMQDIYRSLARLMQTDLTVMITGESGTGKELVATALHDYGKRKRGPFIAVNMAAIPKELIESELFGHEKGAFTGAHARNTGRFEQAQGGTLFLDEIGDMPMDAQTRLLRVLQQGEYTRVGGTHIIKTDVRVIAASNKDLTRLIQQGLFREDLFYRLNVVPLRIPSLRERCEDISDLSAHFFAKMQDEGMEMKSFNAEAMEFLQEYSWPGNVRELENLIARLCALYPEEVITLPVVRQELSAVDHNLNPMNEQHSHEASSDGGKMSIASAVEAFLKDYLKDKNILEVEANIYHTLLEEVEKPLITMVLAMTYGNQIKAADVLGMNRNTLRKKMRELNIPIVKNMKKSS